MDLQRVVLDHGGRSQPSSLALTSIGLAVVIVEESTCSAGHPERGADDVEVHTTSGVPMVPADTFLTMTKSPPSARPRAPDLVLVDAQIIADTGVATAVRSRHGHALASAFRSVLFPCS